MMTATASDNRILTDCGVLTSAPSRHKLFGTNAAAVVPIIPSGVRGSLAIDWAEERGAPQLRPYRKPLGTPEQEVSCHGAPVIPCSHGAGSRGQHSSLPSDRVACPQKSFGSDLPCLPSGSLVLPHLQPSVTVAEAKPLAGGSHPLLALLPRQGRTHKEIA